MVDYKEYIANQLVGKTVHFKCNCLFGLDVKGKVLWHEMAGNEIIYIVDRGNNKTVKIGENTPGLKIEIC